MKLKIIITKLQIIETKIDKTNDPSQTEKTKK